MKRSLYPLTIGLGGVVVFLVFYIMSAIEGTGEGYFMYGEKAYLVMTIVCALAGAYGIYAFYQECRHQGTNPKIRVGICLSIGIIGGGYFLGSAIDNGINGGSFWQAALIAFLFLVVLALSAYDMATLLKQGDSANR